ncbi:hypothetical protein Ancab_010335 [Ancistrocladus abbreviatus]
MPAADALMDDETSHIMRRENQNIASSKSPQKLAVVSQSILSTPTPGVKTRPNPPRPTKVSDQCHHSSPGSDSCKPISALCRGLLFGDQLTADVVMRVFDALAATVFLFALACLLPVSFLAVLVPWLLFPFLSGCPSRSSVLSIGFVEAITIPFSVGVGILSIPYALTEEVWVGLFLLIVALLY